MQSKNEVLTAQELARIFAMYWGCGISNPCDRVAFKFMGVREVLGELKPLLYGDWSGGTHPQTSGTSWCDWEECKLLLTPLPKITDECAINICSMVGWDASDKGSVNTAFINPDGKLEIDFEMNVYKIILSVDIINYCRANSIDMDNLIPRGIAVEK